MCKLLATSLIVLWLLVLTTSGKSLIELRTNSLESPEAAKTKAPRRRLPIHSSEQNAKEAKPLIVATPKLAKPGKAIPLKGGSMVMNLKLRKSDLKGEWCKSRPFFQKLHHQGCNSTYILNNMCFGQCMSFFIPRHFSSCSFCTPVTQNTITIQLKCKEGLRVFKKVNVIKSCRCRSCGRNTTKYV